MQELHWIFIAVSYLGGLLLLSSIILPRVAEHTKLSRIYKNISVKT